MKKLIFWASVALAGFVIWSCKKNDDEPSYPSTPISRLYVSFSDRQANTDLKDYKAIVVFPKADEDTLGKPDTIAFDSPVSGGRGICFDPNIGVVFQGNLARNSQGFNSVQLYTVSNTGSVGSRSTFSDTLLRDIRHVAYDYSHDRLYVASRDTVGTAGYIHGYPAPRNLNGTPRINLSQHLLLSTQPYGVAFVPGKDQLLVSTAGTKQIFLIDSISTRKSGSLKPDKVITISGASRLRGIKYSAKLDLLAIADQEGGRVYVIEHALSVMDNEGDDVTPTRTLNVDGANPQVMDIAIDDRDGKNLLYVIDGFDTESRTGNRRLLRYALDASGSASPQIVYSFEGNQTPYALSLDAREGGDVNSQ